MSTLYRVYIAVNRIITEESRLFTSNKSTIHINYFASCSKFRHVLTIDWTE